MLNDLKLRAARARVTVLSSLSDPVELVLIVLIALLALTIPTALAHPLAPWLAADQSGRVEPRSGAALSYRSLISSDRVIAADGNGLRSGQERPVDLEDWSAHKAETFAGLAPGKTVDSEWPIRLIQAGASGGGQRLEPRPTACRVRGAGKADGGIASAWCRLPAECRCCSRAFWSGARAAPDGASELR